MPNILKHLPTDTFLKNRAQKYWDHAGRFMSRSKKCRYRLKKSSHYAFLVFTISSMLPWHISNNQHISLSQTSTFRELSPSKLSYIFFWCKTTKYRVVSSLSNKSRGCIVTTYDSIFLPISSANYTG